MFKSPSFKSRQASESSDPLTPADLQAFLSRLTTHVSDRFTRLTGLLVVSAPVDWPGPPTNGQFEAPLHPMCRACSGSGSCKGGWDHHVEELHRHAEVHWHRCEQDNLCAVVPVTLNGQCVAACKLVCPASMEERVFERNVELLDVLAEHFAATEGDELAEQLPENTDPERGVTARLAPPTIVNIEKIEHPQVRKALTYIEDHITNPTVSGAGLARELNLNATYLAHIFAEHAGIRMSRYIATRRIELSKVLLKNTDWQIKRIATETGHGNVDWFRQVFRAQTGVTPGDYRKQIAAERKAAAQAAAETEADSEEE